MKIFSFCLVVLLAPCQIQAADQPRRDIVMGTDSPDIYHYYDSETKDEIWGIRSRPSVDTPPETPVLVRPEIIWPAPATPPVTPETARDIP